MTVHESAIRWAREEHEFMFNAADYVLDLAMYLDDESYKERAVWIDAAADIFDAVKSHESGSSSTA